MAFDDDKNKKIVDVIKVVEGNELVLPQGVEIPRIITALQQKMEYDNTVVSVHGVVPVFIAEGAHAFYQVLKAKFGFVNAVATPGMFGPNPPDLLTIEIGDGETVQIPWGRFQLTGIDGWISTGYAIEDNRAVFQINAEVKRRNETHVKEIIEATIQYVRKSPIFGGKAWRIRLKDDYGEIKMNPQPKFIPLNSNILNELVFSEDVMANIETSLFTPIEFTDIVREAKGSLKRGILLSGKYGTGKSMTSAATAWLAVQHGWTFIVCERADELAEVLRIAQDYPRAVVFCEDIDQVLQGERSINMNDILNIVDGVDSKSLELIVVMTTNHEENINQAMLRPGRLDAVIKVSPPDAAAVERLMRQYGRGYISDDLDIRDVALSLDGQIPAVIREVVERAKLKALRANPNLSTLNISREDLVHASLSMQNQLQLLAERVVDERTPYEKGAAIVKEGLVEMARANNHNGNDGAAAAGATFSD